MYMQEKNMSEINRNTPGNLQVAAGAGSGSGGAMEVYCPAGARVFRGLLLFLVLLFTPQMVLAAPDGPPPSVEVQAVTETDVIPASEYVGHVEAIQEVDLRARIEGFLEKIHFQEGDFVHAGDVLYEIEPGPYEARVTADQAKVEQARADLAQAESYLERLQVAGTESITATQMDNAATDVLMKKAKLGEAEAALTLSKLNLGYTTVKAPISGRIGRTAYTEGNLVNPASGPLARIVQMDPIRVVYSISENDLVAIQKAQNAMDNNKTRLLTPQLRLTNGELYGEEGHVSFVDNQVDPATGTIAVRAEFANPADLLIPGQYVTVLVKASAPKMMPVVPQAAVLVNKEGRYVLLVDAKGDVITRPITTGPEIGTGWAVESGLEAGEEIIVSGIQKVRPGQKVQVTHTTSQGK
jgi:RND family efflux transporter MFP subunit